MILGSVGIDGGFDSEELYGVQFECFLVKEEIEQEDPDAPPQFRNTMNIPRLGQISPTLLSYSGLSRYCLIISPLKTVFPVTINASSGLQGYS